MVIHGISSAKKNRVVPPYHPVRSDQTRQPLEGRDDDLTFAGQVSLHVRIVAVKGKLEVIHIIP